MFCVHLPNEDCDVLHLSFFVVTAKAGYQNQERGTEKNELGSGASFAPRSLLGATFF